MNGLAVVAAVVLALCCAQVAVNGPVEAATVEEKSEPLLSGRTRA